MKLSKYIEDMKEKTIRAMENDFKIHGCMIYQCEHCNSIYVMWLTEGLEDPIEYASIGKYKHVPLEFVCPACGRFASHKFWDVEKLTIGQNYRSYKDYIAQQNKVLYQNFFWNDPDSDLGVPIILDIDYSMIDPRNTLKFLYHIIANISMDFKYQDNFKDCLFIDEYSFPKESSVEVSFDKLINRHERRHPNQQDWYKRPRSNKKLYEY